MIQTLDNAILAGFLAFCRVGACFMLMPGLSSIRVPMQVRLFTALAASVALLSLLWNDIEPMVDRRLSVLVPMIFSELATGALIGMMARLYILALQFIGEGVALLIGFNPMAGPSIEEGEPQAALASIISLSALLMLFVFDFHHDIVRALVLSYKMAPVDVFFNARGALADIADTLSDAFFIMIRLGSPFIAYAILVNLAIGFVNKLAPQIPVYFIAQPAVVAGGLVLFYFAFATLIGLFAESFLAVTVGR